MAAALRQVTDDLILSANDAAAASWLPGTSVIPDLRARGGGLAGLEAALSRRHDVIVVAWDMPFVTAALLRALLTVAKDADADAVVPRSDSPRGIEPFCAMYSARVSIPLTAFLDAGDGAAAEFVRRLPNVVYLARDESARFGDPARLFLSVNSASDLERARAMESATR